MSSPSHQKKRQISKRRLAGGLLIFIFSAGMPAGPVGWAGETPNESLTVPAAAASALPDDKGLITCFSQACQVSFLCNPDWKIRILDEFSTIITLSEDPFVTVAISRVDADIHLLGQLSRSFFKEKGLYQDNFQKDYASFAGGRAIELKAFSKIEPDMRYLGYFYIHNDALNSVFFAVYPKDRWDDYKFFIRKIAGSFKRI